jgi:hypothetical protein
LQPLIFLFLCCSLSFLAPPPPARPDLFLANPAQLCRLASSLPLLRLAPSARWLDHFAAVSRSKMYAASPLQLAAYVWALARLGYHPGEWCRIAEGSTASMQALALFVRPRKLGGARL